MVMNEEKNGKTVPLCHSCGVRVKKDENFCSACGKALKSPHQTVGLPDPETSTLYAATARGRIALQPGFRLYDRFEIREVLGHGGMADVFLAHDTVLDDDVAVKVLLPEFADDANMRERLLREVKLARRIKHPNVNSIYEFRSAEGTHFMTMAYIAGETLRSLLDRETKMPMETALRCLHGLIDGLEAAHALNIVHRDLKPSNIMINKQQQPVIMDFGISIVSGMSRMTKKDVMVGTPFYMSPEQMMGRDVDDRSDIYALGTIFYEMVTGRLPFPEKSTIALIYQRMSTDPVPPRDIDPAISPELSDFIMTCLARDVEKRYASIACVREALNAATRGPSIVPRKRILIADDESAIRKMLAYALKRADYDVLEAGDGRQATQMIEEQKPDLVIMDLMMPAMDGLQSLEYLRDRRILQKTPVIVMSAKLTDDYRSYLKSLGIRDTFLKPFNVMEFVERVRGYLPA